MGMYRDIQNRRAKREADLTRYQDYLNLKIRRWTMKSDL